MATAYTMRGPHAELFTGYGDCLLEGPVGTGKSVAGLLWLHSMASRIPNSRWLMARKRRVDMSQSTLVTFENSILGRDHPAIHGSASRPQRRNYLYPNGAEIVVAGMNNPTAVLSMEFNGGFLDEFVEFTREDYELISGRMRNSLNTGGPGERIVTCTNPRGAWHWVNLAADAGLFRRLQSRHCHNPSLYNTETKEWTEAGERYFERIRRAFTGARFSQYVMGEWADDSGRVFPMYDPDIHILDAEVVKDGNRLFLKRKMLDGTPWTREIMWTAAGVDWGYSVPGTIQVWGWDKDEIAYLLAEVYHSRKDATWWARQMVDLAREFRPVRVICDSAEPDRIHMFNDYLGELSKREEDRLAIRCYKDRSGNLAHLQALMLPSQSTTSNPTGSRVYLLKNTLRNEPDPDQAGRGRPVCLHDELLNLMYLERDDDKPLRDRIDPTLDNHATDAALYLHRWAWQRDHRSRPEERPIEPGSFADILGHRAKLEAAAAAQRN